MLVGNLKKKKLNCTFIETIVENNYSKMLMAGKICNKPLSLMIYGVCLHGGANLHQLNGVV